MLCTICNKPVVLSPSANERAAKDVTGKTAAFYTSLFPQHTECSLAKRKEGVKALCARLKEQEKVLRDAGFSVHKTKEEQEFSNDLSRRDTERNANL